MPLKTWTYIVLSMRSDSYKKNKLNNKEPINVALNAVTVRHEQMY